MLRFAAFRSLARFSAPSVAGGGGVMGSQFYSVFGMGNLSTRLGNSCMIDLGLGPQRLMQARLLNRNARRPKRANHGKRPVSHARKREKMKSLKSRLYREKVFGFW